MLVGYARVSTFDQNPSLQIDALRDAGCGKIYIEKASGARRAARNRITNGETISAIAREMKTSRQTNVRVRDQN